MKLNPADFYRVSVRRIDNHETISTTSSAINTVIRFMNDNYHGVDILENGNVLEMILAGYPVIYRAYPLHSLVK